MAGLFDGFTQENPTFVDNSEKYAKRAELARDRAVAAETSVAGSEAVVRDLTAEVRLVGKRAEEAVTSVEVTHTEVKESQRVVEAQVFEANKLSEKFDQDKREVELARVAVNSAKDQIDATASGVQGNKVKVDEALAKAEAARDAAIIAEGEALLSELKAKEWADKAMTEGRGVVSVNGKQGEISLNHTDVQAAPDGFGLGGYGNSLSNKSCNDIEASGFYGIYSATTGTPYSSGGPSGSTLIHTSWGSAGASQMFFAYTADRVHYRRKYQSVWGEWFEIFHSGKLPTLAQLGAVGSVNGKTGTAISLSAADVGAVSVGDLETGDGKVMRVGGPRDNQIAQALANTTGGAYVSNTAPPDPFLGMRWFDTTDGRTYIWYIDEDSAQWVEENPQSPDAITHSELVNDFANKGLVKAVKVTTSDAYGFTSAARSFQGMYMGIGAGDKRTIIGGGGDAVGDKSGSVLIRPNGITDAAGVTLFNPDGTIVNSNAPTNANHLTNKGYVDAQVKVVNDKVDTISPIANAAMPKLGGTFAGQIELKPATMGGLIVSDKASIMFRDGVGSWMHQQANGNTLRWSHGGNADYTLMELSASGLNVQNPVYAKTGVIAQSADETSWIGIETPVGAAPYISSRTPAEAQNVISMRFGQTEVSVESGKRMAASSYRVGNDGGLKFAPTNDLSGLTWAFGMDPNSRNFGLHYYSNGGYAGQTWHVNASGETTIYGPGLNVTGRMNMTNYASINGGSNNILEYHQQGHSAVMTYKPVNTYDLRIAQSNGAGGESAMYANLNASVAQFAGQVLSMRSSNRSWGQVGQSVFYGNGSVSAPGYLSSLVSQWLTIQGMAAYEHGYGFLSDQSGNIGNYGHAFWCNDGGPYHRHWIFRNNGGMDSPSGLRISGEGHVYGDAYGSQESLAKWATSNFAPASDARLKTVLGETTKSALDVVDQFQFKKFTWNEGAGDVYTTRDKKITEIGLIAQEVEAIDPTLVKTIRTEGDDAIDVKSLDTASMLALALKAIQELKAEVAELKAAK